MPIKFFLDRCLPPLDSETDISKIKQKMKKAGSKSWRSITSSNRWRGFPKDPICSSEPDSRCFTHLVEVVDAIGKHTRLSRNQTIGRFKINTDRVPLLHNRDSDSLPDAYLLVPGSKLADDWKNIVIPCELSKSDSLQDEREVSGAVASCSARSKRCIAQNYAKVTQSMNNCMRLDPLRRFTFGITIENASMRFWFCDRSVLVVSEKFDFITVSSM